MMMPLWQRNLIRLVIVLVCIYVTAFLSCGPPAKRKNSHLKRADPVYRADSRCTTIDDRFIVHAPTEYQALVKLAESAGFDLDDG